MNEMLEKIQQTHRPSRKGAIAFFFLALAIAAFVVVWVFFINKGTLMVEGETPFSVSVGNKEVACASSPCSIKLSPRSYGVTIKKEGFYENSQTAEIKRAQETKITAHFQFIPVLQEVGELILPFPSAPLRTTFIGLKKFENFPKDAKEMQFSPSGNQALILLGREIYLYDVTQHSIAETNFREIHSPAWVAENIAYIEEVESKHILKIWKNGKPETAVTFERPFKNPKLFGEAGGGKILIAETSDANASYYLIDISKKSRRRLDVAGDWKNPVWAADYIIFEKGEGDSKEIIALDTTSFERTAIPALDSKNVLAQDSDVLVFFSREAALGTESKLGPSISEVIETAKKETLAPGELPSNAYLVEFNIKTNKGKTLVAVPIKAGKTPKKLAFDPSEKKIFFELEGRLFEVILEK